MRILSIPNGGIFVSSGWNQNIGKDSSDVEIGPFEHELI